MQPLIIIIGSLGISITISICCCLIKQTYVNCLTRSEYNIQDQYTAV